MKAAGQPVKVLVADDSAVSRKLVEHTLSEKQYSLVFAKSGRETLDLFAEHRPALVIVDWIMPDLTGLEICQHIRSRAQASYTYIILLTGKSEKESVVEGLAAGADDYVRKPFDNEELRHRVRSNCRCLGLWSSRSIRYPECPSTRCKTDSGHRYGARTSRACA